MEPQPAESRPEEQPNGDDAAAGAEWMEVEDVDPETGELLGTGWQRLDADGEPSGPIHGTRPTRPPAITLKPGWRPQLRIGVVVSLARLLGVSDSPGQLADRSGLVPGEAIRDLIADALGKRSKHAGVLFTRLLTDDGGRLLDVTELGRSPSARLAEALRIRAGTCRYPSCTVPAERCDNDHHEPWPQGLTRGDNLDPLCRRHHRAKTFAWLASLRDHDSVEWTLPDANTYRCVDEPVSVGDG